MAMPEQLALFVEAAAETARPAAAWLKQKRVEAPWAIDTSVDLARRLLLTLHGKDQAVGVSPLCRPEASAAETSTEDLAALRATLDVISVVGKVSSLLAWVLASFWGQSPWLHGCCFHCPCGLGAGCVHSLGTLALRRWPD